MPNAAESSSKEEIKELMIQNDNFKKSDMDENQGMDVEIQNSEDSNETKEKDEEESEDSNEIKEEEEEEIEECGLFKYIKGGECKEIRKIFKTCMFNNPVYYEPIITAQAHVVARMISELQAEKEAVLAGDAAAIAKALSKLQTEEQPVLLAEVAAIAKAFQDLKADKEDIAKGNEP